MGVALKPALPLHRWPKDTYLNAASHDADSNPFRLRQLARIEEANKAREAAAKSTVRPIGRKKA